MPKMDLTKEEVAFIKALRATKGKEHIRAAYISGLWAFIPDSTIVGRYRRVRTAVALHPCDHCGAVPGELCHSATGPTIGNHAARGLGIPKTGMSRIALAASLITKKYFDHVELCSVIHIFNAEKMKELK